MKDILYTNMLVAILLFFSLYNPPSQPVSFNVAIDNSLSGIVNGDTIMIELWRSDFNPSSVEVYGISVKE